MICDQFCYNMWLTLEKFCEWVKNKSRTSREIAQNYLSKIAKDTTNSFVRTHESYVDRNVDIFSERLFCWAAVGVKDIFLTKGYEVSCASKMLEWYIPPYSATCIKKLEEAWWLMIGKTNMDEFAMGTTGETSYYWPVTNPYDETRVSWWSSSWSAAAVAEDLCIVSLWTDTWWSVRLPASWCGIVWMKATYWRISRYWVQAMASSFDHVWVFSKVVEDWVRVMQAMSWHDSHDATTCPWSNDTSDWLVWLWKTDLNGKKLAVIKQFLWEGIDEDSRALIEKNIEVARWLWAEIAYVDLPIVEFCIPTYYILVPAEVSTNMARFDGIRFWHQKNTKEFDTIYDYYATIRKEWFWEEVKRRILTGSYVLSAWYYDAYYKKALRARKKIQMEVDKVFWTYDAIIGPISTSPAPKVWANEDNPIALYLMDIYTVLANLTQTPALSIPCWYVERWWKKLPVWFQIMTKKRDEATMFSIASTLEKAFAFKPLHSLTS